MGEEGRVDIVKCGKFERVGGSDDGRVGLGVAADKTKTVAKRVRGRVMEEGFGGSLVRAVRLGGRVGEERI